MEERLTEVLKLVIELDSARLSVGVLVSVSNLVHHSSSQLLHQQLVLLNVCNFQNR